MALKTFVKVSEVNNLSDARYCAGMGVDVLGFNIDSLDEGFVPPEKFLALKEWVSGVAYAAEFSVSAVADIEKQLKNYEPFDFIQIDNPDYLPDLLHLQMPIILAVDISDFQHVKSLEAHLRKVQHQVKYFLLENGEEGFMHISLDEVLALADNYPVLLEYGINADNVNNIIAETRVGGIALRGGDEIRPGYKHFDELADILEAIETDD